MENAVHRITVYRKAKSWVFDEPALGLIAEPFVAGASEIITSIKRAKNIRRRTLDITFSQGYLPFPDATLVCTEKVREVEYYKDRRGVLRFYTPKDAKYTSAFYKVVGTDQTCWLCPAQLKFFNNVAQMINIKVE